MIAIFYYISLKLINSSSKDPPKKRKVQPTPASLTNPRWRLHRPRLSARLWPWTRKPGSPAGLEFLRADFHWQRRWQDSVDPPICHVPSMHGEEAANTTWHLCLYTPVVSKQKYVLPCKWKWDEGDVTPFQQLLYCILSAVCDMISFCNHCFNSGHNSIAPSFSTYVFPGIGPQHPQTSPNLPPVSRERNSTIRSSGANATPGMKSKHSLKASCWLGK